MTWAQRWFGWLVPPPTIEVEIVEPEIFLEFDCKCGHKIQVEDMIKPGEAGVITCENCGEVWAAICPPLEVRPIKEVEELWPILSQ